MSKTVKRGESHLRNRLERRYSPRGTIRNQNETPSLGYYKTMYIQTGTAVIIFFLLVIGTLFQSGESMKQSISETIHVHYPLNKIYSAALKTVPSWQERIQTLLNKN